LKQINNITPRAIAQFIALVAFVLAVAVCLFAKVGLVASIIICIAMPAIIGFVVYKLVDEYLHKRVKLIFKLISATKSNYQQDSLFEILPRETDLQALYEQVQSWAKDEVQELELLKRNEAYRRDFLMNFSHEIKTPIFTVQGYLHTLRDGAINDEGLRDKFLGTSVKGIDRLARMVNELDELVQLEQGILKLQATKFIIADLIDEVYEELELQASTKQIKLLWKDNAKLEENVLADKDKIRQIIINLVINAIRYGKQNGHVLASIDILEDQTCYIEITDNGIGIEAEMVPRVFERFFRTTEARNSNKAGLGLGLAIVKHLVEAHGHTLTCRSTIDVGTSIGFSLTRA
jgi:two-component system, OmpR family, phosphate regulon sensor histidine kinase PhoR